MLLFYFHAEERTSSIVLQTNNSYFVKHSLVEKTKLYLIFVTLVFQVKTNKRR